MWMKYRHKWNSGVDKDFEWKLLTRREKCTVEDAEVLAQSFISENFYGELYDYYGAWRGVEHEIVPHPPLDVVANLIFEQRKTIKSHVNMMHYYTEIHNKITNG